VTRTPSDAPLAMALLRPTLRRPLQERCFPPPLSSVERGHTLPMLGTVLLGDDSRLGSLYSAQIVCQQKATVNISLWCDSTYSYTSTLRSAAVVPDCVAAVQSSAFLHMRLASPEFGRPKSPPPTCQTHNGPALLQSPSTENHHLRSKERPVLPDFHGENKRKGSTGSFAARAWGRNSSTTPPPGSCRVRADLRCAILAGLKTPWIVSAPPPRRRTSGSTHLN
jgi:hypothetical protein